MYKSTRFTRAEKREIFYIALVFSFGVIAIIVAGFAFGWAVSDIIYHLITH